MSVRLRSGVCRVCVESAVFSLQERAHDRAVRQAIRAAAGGGTEWVPGIRALVEHFFAVGVQSPESVAAHPGPGS